ncbi:hypothetical protein M8494_10205 [Serratia ureilytica]
MKALELSVAYRHQTQPQPSVGGETNPHSALPGGTELDMQAGGRQSVTVEDSDVDEYASSGKLKPASELLRSGTRHRGRHGQSGDARQQGAPMS